MIDNKNNNPHKKLGITIFTAGAGLILFYFLLVNMDVVKSGFDSVVSILMPFILGAVMAYILCPVYNLFVKVLYKQFAKKIDTAKAFSTAKALSTIISLIILVGFLTGFVWLVIPNLIDTISKLIVELPDQISGVINWINSFFSDNTAGKLGELLNTVQKGLTKWAEESLLPNAGSIMSTVTSSLYSIVMFIINLVIGIIVFVYMLNYKDLFMGQVKKIVVAVCRKKRAEKIFKLFSDANRIFGGFINGKIIDSAIIGVICFIGMTIVGLPYPTLISVIIGITNIIPFFGPFLGAIPSALLILIKDPIQCLIFVAWVIILQQFDGYILGPKILGNTTGLSSFWVMFSILVFGGVFGFVGMIIGVPTFALIYAYFKDYIGTRLERKDIAENTFAYEDFSIYGIEDKKDILPKKKEK
ncbi:MAG: AI-2E family transporter [Clostridia bacterium]|nr:AI-2E family transporter [Clostridia bacterium]